MDHDIRRSCAVRLINAGSSTETLTTVLRHEDFKTTEKCYGAIREAQSAAIQQKLSAECKKDALVD
jgi:integrase